MLGLVEISDKLKSVLPFHRMSEQLDTHLQKCFSRSEGSEEVCQAVSQAYKKLTLLFHIQSHPFHSQSHHESYKTQPPSKVHHMSIHITPLYATLILTPTGQHMTTSIEVTLPCFRITIINFKEALGADAKFNNHGTEVLPVF